MHISVMSESKHFIIVGPMTPLQFQIRSSDLFSRMVLNTNCSCRSFSKLKMMKNKL